MNCVQFIGAGILRRSLAGLSSVGGAALNGAMRALHSTKTHTHTPKTRTGSHYGTPSASPLEAHKRASFAQVRYFASSSIDVSGGGGGGSIVEGNGISIKVYYYYYVCV